MGKDASNMSDRILVERFLASRSEQAFKALYRAKSPHLYQMALRLAQDATVADELLQETWVVAIRRLESFEWRSELKTWLIGVLINTFRNHQKAKEAVALEESEAKGHDFSENYQTSHDLEKGIGQLSPGHRQIILLYDVEGYKHREIAEMLGISEGTSKSQLHDARKALRTFLEEHLNA